MRVRRTGGYAWRLDWEAGETSSPHMWSLREAFKRALTQEKYRDSADVEYAVSPEPHMWLEYSGEIPELLGSTLDLVGLSLDDGVTCTETTYVSVKPSLLRATQFVTLSTGASLTIISEVPARSGPSSVRIWIH